MAEERKPSDKNKGPELIRRGSADALEELWLNESSLQQTAFTDRPDCQRPKTQSPDLKPQFQCLDARSLSRWPDAQLRSLARGVSGQRFHVSVISLRPSTAVKKQD